MKNFTVTSDKQLKTCNLNWEAWLRVKKQRKEEKRETIDTLDDNVMNTEQNRDCLPSMEQSLKKQKTSHNVNEEHTLMFPTIQDTLDWCHKLVSSTNATKLHVLCTGSIHLLGGIVKIIESENSDDSE